MKSFLRLKEHDKVDENKIERPAFKKHEKVANLEVLVERLHLNKALINGKNKQSSLPVYVGRKRLHRLFRTQLSWRTNGTETCREEYGAKTQMITSTIPRAVVERHQKLLY